jgi:hypothetical protein
MAKKGPLFCALKQFKFSRFPLEVNLSTMDVQSLMDLRKRVDERLLECRTGHRKAVGKVGQVNWRNKWPA